MSVRLGALPRQYRYFHDRNEGYRKMVSPSCDRPFVTLLAFLSATRAPPQTDARKVKVRPIKDAVGSRVCKNRIHQSPASLRETMLNPPRTARTVENWQPRSQPGSGVDSAGSRRWGGRCCLLSTRSLARLRAGARRRGRASISIRWAMPAVSPQGATSPHKRRDRHAGDE